MEHLDPSRAAAKPEVLALGFDLMAQLQAAETHYNEACDAAFLARDELRRLTTREGSLPECIAAARARFEAIAARCTRLRDVIEDLRTQIE